MPLNDVRLARLIMDVAPMPQLVLSAKPGLPVVYANPAFTRTIGPKAEELIAVSIPGDPRLDAPHVFDEVASTGKNVSTVVSTYRLSGDAFWYELHVAPIYDHTGQLTHYIACQHDITDRIHLEESLIAATDLEQRRIARDLHDGVGQYLTGMLFTSKALCDRLRKEGSPHLQLAESILNFSEQAASHSRAIVHNMHLHGLEELGLAVTLEKILAVNKEIYGVEYDLLADDIPAMDLKTASNFCRIAQEAIHNATKHAFLPERSLLISVRLKYKGDCLELTVTDNGRGLRAEEMRNGFGLTTMAIRARSIGADLSVRPGPAGRGTTISCRLTLPPIMSRPPDHE